MLLAALRAHGFHPLDWREGGLPGLPNFVRSAGRVAIEVPEGEADDARLLVNALIAEMGLQR